MRYKIKAKNTVHPGLNVPEKNETVSFQEAHLKSPHGPRTASENGFADDCTCGAKARLLEVCIQNPCQEFIESTHLR